MFDWVELEIVRAHVLVVYWLQYSYRYKRISENEICVMEWIWERYKVSAMHKNKYTARHTISVPVGNGQAGRAPDSRETIRVRVADLIHWATATGQGYLVLYNLLCLSRNRLNTYVCHGQKSGRANTKYRYLFYIVLNQFYKTIL